MTRALNLMQRSHRVLNIGLVLCMVIFGAVAANRYLIRQTDPAGSSTSSSLKPGSRLDLKDLDWAQNRRTLVLALSNTCSFCSQSADFYRKLLQELKGRSEIHTLAIFSESLTDAQRYLKDINVSVDNVRQAPLVTLGFKGTPTLLLINESGQITELWFGKLTTEEESEVMVRIRAELDRKNLPSNTDATDSQIGPEDLDRIIKSGQTVAILDVRDRQQYAGSHAEGSKNIPIDEINVRAPNELSPNDFIVTSCRCADAGLSMTARDKLVKIGFKKVAVLREQ